jgi:hypothetical protein
VITLAFVLAFVAMVLTAAGAATARRWRPRVSRAPSAAGPYRVPRLAPSGLRVQRSGERLVAAGGALLACVCGPALVTALLSLKWEGIGVTLLPALLLVAARLYASLVTFRGSDLGAARTIAHASLLLDVPLLAFSILHMRVIESGVDHGGLSLAAVAGAFAAADGLQAALVLAVPFTHRASVVRE